MERMGVGVDWKVDSANSLLWWRAFSFNLMYEKDFMFRDYGNSTFNSDLMDNVLDDLINELSIRYCTRLGLSGGGRQRAVHCRRRSDHGLGRGH